MKLPARTHVVLAGAVEAYGLYRPLPLAAQLAVKLAWLWEFHLRAEAATKSARGLFGWGAAVAWALALLPLTSVLLRDYAAIWPLAPGAEAMASSLLALAATAEWQTLAALARRLDWSARVFAIKKSPPPPAARARKKDDDGPILVREGAGQRAWGLLLALVAGAEVLALRALRARTGGAGCDTRPGAAWPLPKGPFTWARRIARKAKKRPLAAPEACDVAGDRGLVTIVVGVVATLDLVLRWHTGAPAPRGLAPRPSRVPEARGGAEALARLITHPLLSAAAPLIPAVAAWVDADVTRAFALARIAVAAEPIRAAAKKRICPETSWTRTSSGSGKSPRLRRSLPGDAVPGTPPRGRRKQK